MDATFHEEKGPYLRSLTPGQHFVGYYTLRSKELEQFRDPTRGNYLTLVLSDRSGQMLARVWENAEDLHRQLRAGSVVKIEGEVESFQGRDRITVRRIRPADPEEYDPRDLVPASDRDPDQMMAELKKYIEAVQEPHLSSLLSQFFDDSDFLARYAQAPAARRIHHAYLSGLLEHTLEVLSICQRVLEIYPQIDADLLLTGALLHDIGKTREYEWGLDMDYTAEGRLLGHIVITDEMIADAIRTIPDFPEELALRLRHMLIAHHGRLEWGSPREPQTLEAIALHHIENLDAQINRFHLLLRDLPPGEMWTPYDRLLRRQLYAGPQADADEPTSELED